MIQQGIMEEHESFQSHRSIKDDEEIVVIFYILKATLRVREWGLFVGPTKLYQWERLWLAPAFKPRGENLFTHMTIPIKRLRKWWEYAHIVLKLLVGFATL